MRKLLIKQLQWSRPITIKTRLSSGGNNALDQKSLITVKKYLKSEGGEYYDGFTCLKVNCNICNNAGTKPYAYINKTTGLFTCPSCQISSHISSVLAFYSENRSSELIENLTKSLFLKKLEEYRSDDECSLEPATIEHFKEINICLPESVPEALGVRYNRKKNTLHFPFKNVAGRVVGERVLQLESKYFESTKPETTCHGVIMYSQTSRETKAILVLNVLDLLAVISQKTGFAVICLPYGLRSLPQESLPGLEKSKELILWFDFDVAGWDTTKHFARKLGENRCLFIRPTGTDSTPYLAHKAKLNLKSILSKAHPLMHKSITTFSSLREDVLSELRNIEKVHGVTWTRYPTLNKLLKGHRKAELTILTGPTGCGKTTFMSEYSLDLAMQGVTTLWGSFEIKNTRLAATILRQIVGYPLDDKLEEFDHWADQLERLPIYFMTFHGQQNIKVVMEAVEHAQYVHDIHHVIIDNVQFMLGLSSSSKYDKFWEQDAVIAAFRNFATKKNVHVTLVMHPRKEKDADDLTTSSIFGNAKATQEADNVLIIQDKRLTSVRGKKYLQVAKNRYSGDLGIMPLEFDKDSLSYGKKKKEK